MRAFDTRRNQRLGTLWPGLWDGTTSDQWVCVGPTGHWRGSEKAVAFLVYVALHNDGSQRTYSPTEFAEKFGWKNDTEKATLLKLTDEK